MHHIAVALKEAERMIEACDLQPGSGVVVGSWILTCVEDDALLAFATKNNSTGIHCIYRHKCGVYQIVS